LIEIEKVSWNESLKVEISYTGECVTQVVRRLPPLSVVRQACYIFFNSPTQNIKDKTILFLLLLSSTDQIKEAIEANKLKEGEDGYLVRCCKSDLEKYSPIAIESLDERLMLTFNAINSPKRHPK
jgi:hypothetical protein